MIENGIRGEIATLSHRHANGNNEYMETEFDPAKESKFISYLDADNLYDWAMSKQLPTYGFKWMTDDELDSIIVSSFISIQFETIKQIINN